ncbi:MAG: A24 family peptidase [Clostridia bacterium]|nr:A24 family peptidase [Clostridia bacterium]
MLLIDYLLLLVLAVSIYTDIREQKIYNIVLFPAFLLAWAFHFRTGGGTGLLTSLHGAGLGLGLFLIPYVAGGLGAGDVKLLALVGACKGSAFVFTAFFLTALLGGIIALALLIYRGELLKVWVRLKDALIVCIFSSFKVWNLGSLKDAGSVSFPYGVAIALGSMITYVVM